MLISAARIYLADYFSAFARLILQYIDTENKAWFPWQPRYEVAVSALCCFGFYWVRLLFEGSLRLKIGQPCRKLQSESGFTCSLINCKPAFYFFLSDQQTHRRERSHFPEKRRFPHSLSVESWFLRNKLPEWYVRSENDCFSPSLLRQLPLIISRKWQGYVA